MATAQTAKAYILYRKQHQELREFHHLLINTEKMVDEYVSGNDWRVNENSNMNYSLQGLNNHLISAVTSKYWLEKVYPEPVRQAHQEGDLHIHDLSLLAPYCCWLGSAGSAASGALAEYPRRLRVLRLGTFALPWDKLSISSTPCRGEAAGAQAFANFDTYLAPFIAYDNLSYDEVKQSIQEFIFNLNVPTRVGFQTPFVNITMDVVVPRNLADEPAIIGGQPQDRTLKEFQAEMDMLNTAFCEVMMEGDAKGRIFSFPIPTYNIYEGFDWDSPVVEKIMEMTAKYGIPYFANFINS